MLRTEFALVCLGQELCYLSEKEDEEEEEEEEEDDEEAKRSKHKKA